MIKLLNSKNIKSDIIIALVMMGLGAFMFIFGMINGTPISIMGIIIIFVGVFYGYYDNKNDKSSSYDYKTHGDFRKYYDTKRKRNIWVLGYFGGGAVNISNANVLAEEYAKEYNVPYNTVQIDEILKSRRYKYFKFIFSTEKQSADKEASCYDDVYGMLTD